EHIDISHRVHVFLGGYILRERLGILATPDAGFIFGRGPDTVLSPDAAFVRSERLPRPRPSKGFVDVVPDLVVEINSPNDRRAQIDRKIAIYLRSGVLLIWEIDPETQTVREHRPNSDVVVLRKTDILDGGEIVRGFSLPVAELFDTVWTEPPIDAAPAR
ncbi:MAG: Uma2 family endonuclease, partial [Burkholderiales bacterium]|nr:Uma2 family endonuclease [Burkholderiales bacterium]